MSFRACRVFEDDGGVAPRVVEMDTDELSPGDVVVRGSMDVTDVSTGATLAWAGLGNQRGVSGRGVTVAVVDSVKKEIEKALGESREGDGGTIKPDAPCEAALHVLV